MPTRSLPARAEPIPVRLLVLAAVTLALCAADATITLTLIATSSFYEANPVMDALLRIDTRLFVVGKMLVTGAGLAVMLRYSNATVFRSFPVSRVLTLTCAMYFALVGYEIAMLVWVV